jgi:hypothetical protein
MPGAVTANAPSDSLSTFAVWQQVASRHIAGCAWKKVAVEYTCSMGRHGPAKNSASPKYTCSPYKTHGEYLEKYSTMILRYNVEFQRFL